jgi:hypothetical protein
MSTKDIIVYKQDIDEPSVRDSWEKFNKEIHKKSPDLISVIISGLKFIGLIETLIHISENQNSVFKIVNNIYDVVESSSRHKQDFDHFKQDFDHVNKLVETTIKQTKNIKLDLIKTSKMNLDKTEVQQLIIDVHELQFITKIESPELQNTISFCNEFIEFLKTIVTYIEPQQTIPEKTPFRDQKTAELFEYIVENWNYNAATKWGYIWNYFIQRGNGKMTFKIDYESYLIERGLITKGKPNYEACNSSNRYDQLDELKRQFLENLDLK